jgi:hypothetical protein
MDRGYKKQAAIIMYNKCVTLNGETWVTHEQLEILQKAGYLRDKCVMLNGRIKITHEEMDRIKNAK